MTAFIVGVYLAVKDNLFDVPSTVAQYLLDTLFTRFSPATLRSLLGDSEPSWKLPALLILYWGYHVVAPLLMFLGSLVIFSKRLDPPYRRGLAKVVVLQDSVRRYEDQPSHARRAGVRGSIRESNFYPLIVPVSSEWFTKPEFQWLSPQAIGVKERAIITSLHKLSDAMLVFLRARTSLERFLQPLALLEDFFFVVRPTQRQVAFRL